MQSLDDIVGTPINIPSVVDADYLGDYKLQILFKDGKSGVFDFSKLFDKPFYAKLKDRHEFIQFGLEYGTLVWANGVDISPEYLYQNISPTVH